MKTFFEFKQDLLEKLVIVGNDQKYGQVIFLAGGSGSGKGFAVSNFINTTTYRVFDPDKIKDTLLKWNQTTKKYPELLGRNLKDPKDTEFVHKFIRDVVKWDKKEIQTFLAVNRPDKTTLPNIVFDKTFKDAAEFEELVPQLLKAGYKKENMHLIWVLRNYKFAIQANAARDRTVPLAVLIQTHSGAAQTMRKFLLDNYPTDLIDGDAAVILGGDENTIFFKPAADAPKTRQAGADAPITPKPRVVKDFQYVKVKDARSAFKPSVAITNTILRWILDHSPDQEAIEKYLTQ